VSSSPLALAWLGGAPYDKVDCNFFLDRGGSVASRALGLARSQHLGLRRMLLRARLTVRNAQAEGYHSTNTGDTKGDKVRI